MTLLTFATYLWIDPENYLDPGKAFMTLSLFNILRTPLDFMASIISLAAQVGIICPNIFFLFIMSVMGTAWWNGRAQDC